MAAVAAQTIKIPSVVRTSPPHPSAAILGARADAAKAKFETGYRRARAPDWLIEVLACLVGLAVFVAAWALVSKFGGSIPVPLRAAKRRRKSFPVRSITRGRTAKGSAG